MIIKLDNLLTQDELSHINNLFDSLPDYTEEFPALGRLHVQLHGFPRKAGRRLNQLVNDLLGTTDLELLYDPLAVEYNAKYGNPVLRPHFDGDNTDAIIDLQLSSSPNTSWPLGINRDVYDLKDNEALLFNPNENIHWRPEKTFQSDEYIRMIFFRFFNRQSPSDYSHLPHNPNAAIFNEVKAIRESLKAND